MLGDPRPLAAPAIDGLDGDRMGRHPDGVGAAAPEIEAIDDRYRAAAAPARRLGADDEIDAATILVERLWVAQQSDAPPAGAVDAAEPVAGEQAVGADALGRKSLPGIARGTSRPGLQIHRLGLASEHVAAIRRQRGDLLAVARDDEIGRPDERDGEEAGDDRRRPPEPPPPLPDA